MGLRRPAGPERPPAHPLVNDETDNVLSDAVVHLLTLRGLEWGDQLAELHALISLAIQLRLRLPDAIVAAIDHSYTWSDVAEQLDITPASARRRHGHHLECLWPTDPLNTLNQLNNAPPPSQTTPVNFPTRPNTKPKAVADQLTKQLNPTPILVTQRGRCRREQMKHARMWGHIKPSRWGHFVSIRAAYRRGRDAG